MPTRYELELDEPVFQIVPLRKPRWTYELRHYFQSKWTSTKIHCRKYRDGMEQLALPRLFDYHNGKNSSVMKIPNTVPIVSKIEHIGNKDNFTGITMTTSFFLPKRNQRHPPVPAENSVVFTETKTDLCVFVRRFSGHAKNEDWLAHAEALRADLRKDGLHISNKPIFYAVTYGNPFRPRSEDRRNEVWIRAAGSY